MQYRHDLGTEGKDKKQYRAQLGPRIIFFLLILSFSGRSQTAQVPGVFDNVSVGAFDPDAWNGVVFDAAAYGQRLPFAIRVGSKTNTFVDGDRIFDAVSMVGPHAPDESYALMGWRNYPRMAQITLEWSRVNQTTLVGRLKAPPDVHLVLEAYSPYEEFFTGEYHISGDGARIIGDHPIDGHLTTTLQFIVATDRPILGSGTFTSVTQLQKVMDAGHIIGTGPQAEGGGAAGLEFVPDGSSTAHFVATIGWNDSVLAGNAKELLTSRKIDEILEQNAAAYLRQRPHIEGLFNGASEAIGNSMFWNSIYVSPLGLEFPTISRRWDKGFGGWVVGEWDCFFGSLLTNVEDVAQTSASVRAILLSQSPNGVVPNVDGGSGTSPDRSQPPVGSYVVWKNYERNQDKELLEWAYPRLKKWHEWWFADRGDGQPWRDGNHDGLLEWGSDKGSSFSVGGRGFLQAAKWESGMDDSPMYDNAVYDPITYTMNLDDVGLNALYVLDSECLAKIAETLGKADDKQRFMDDYSRVKSAMQRELWNEKDGIYENRFWDGHFSDRLSPTNFYPLLAGVATREQAKRMIQEHLLNPKEFWGKYVIPTVSRRDPAFEDQYYWRGDIWGPTNYLVYEGLNRYGEDEIALQFAQKSYELFMEDWHANQHTNEQYYAWGGSAGGDKHYTWGALLCLIPMEQYLDETPWDGLRFGALNPKESGLLTNITRARRRYNITVGPYRTALERDGSVRFEADNGVVVRRYVSAADSLSFTIKATRLTNIITRESGVARLFLSIDGQRPIPLTVHHGAVAFKLPSGEHRIVETWN